MSRTSKYYYRRNLPHYRGPGAIYHVRLSVQPPRELSADWMFEIVEKSLMFRHKQTYLLRAYEIMSNHTHAVIEPLPNTPNPEEWTELANFYRLEDILCGIKKHTSLDINRRLAKRGRLWMKEYFDRTIRGEKDLIEVIDYIHHNAVRWRLVERPEDYRWSSLRTIYSGRAEYDAWFDWEP